MLLSEIKTGESCVITKVRGRGAFRKRITEMGFIKGKLVKAVKNAPLNDPIEYQILGYDISLRRAEASQIEVVYLENYDKNKHTDYNGIIDSNKLKHSVRGKDKIINIAFVGNPNCGKTTLYNAASGAHEHVGNYSGVTVESKQIHYHHNGYRINLVDLPGTYSLSAYTPEELYVRKYIYEEIPDIVINVVDSSNLERNLFLTTQLIDMDIKVVIALNMYDEIEKTGSKFDHETLGKLIGIPMIPTVGSKSKGIKELFDKVVQVYEDKDESVRHIHINYGKEIEKSLSKIQEKIKTKENFWITDKISSRFAAIKLLENDDNIKEIISKVDNADEIFQTANKRIKRLENAFVDKSETVIADSKYGFINGALRETFTNRTFEKVNNSTIIDAFLTHKIFGFPLFIFFIWLMFQTTFSLGKYPMEWIDNGVGLIGDLIHNFMPAGMLKDLLIDGVIGGVGGIIVFLPNILILFFFISIMEDTGYMARAAFIMDKIMHKIGLHGKSFIPLIMGFGCNVPAIMATRTLENRTDRIITILINPFMSCSARLPVYLLLTAAFFPNNAGNIIFLIYIIGIAIAVITAKFLKKTFFAKEEVPFVMELPPYRIPTVKTTVLHMWHKAEQYLKKMGGIILIASIIIWALGYFPRDIEFSKDYNEELTVIENNYTEILETVNDSLKIVEATEKRNIDVKKIIFNKETERQKNSYIGQIGQFIVPVLKPLGFDWKMAVSMLTGIAAKEIVVSTMGVLYQADETNKNSSLVNKLQTQIGEDGNPKSSKSKLTAFSLMLFVLIYFPCIAVVASVRKETGSWKWAAFLVFYSTGIAWIVSFEV